ncbi:MAG: type II toxin-antitoxin system RelE/ParE family toxin [Chrysiogenetes bacterium]|nr:type II toxin-antitoxin system RelE/ParE family toxin [Chrysiogenetes bacterium]
MATIIVTEEFENWAQSLSRDDRKALARIVGLLEARGITLGFPYCSALRGSRAGLRELRVQAKGKPIRVIYAFDPKRQAVLLLGADKTGEKRFYLEKIREAEALWHTYLENLSHAEKN